MRRLLSALAIAALGSGLATAQVPVGVDLPEGSALTISHEVLTFDLTETPFPPASFPAFFEPTDVEEPLELRLFSNLEGGWVVEMAFEGLLEGDSDAFIGPSQVEYRVDGGPWFELAPSVTLVNGQGATDGYESHQIEFRLRLEGNESPGSYEGTLIFHLARL